MATLLQPVGIDSFRALVLEAPGPVVVEFGKESCSSCRALQPVLERFARRHPEVAILSCDVTTDASLARLYGVTTLPTTALFRAGRLADCVIGFQGDAGIEALLETSPPRRSSGRRRGRGS